MSPRSAGVAGVQFRAVINTLLGTRVGRSLCKLTPPLEDLGTEGPPWPAAAHPKATVGIRVQHPARPDLAPPSNRCAVGSDCGSRLRFSGDRDPPHLSRPLLAVPPSSLMRGPFESYMGALWAGRAERAALNFVNFETSPHLLPTHTVGCLVYRDVLLAGGFLFLSVSES